MTTADALDMSVSEEEIWSNNDFEKAISLIAVRSLLFQRAGGLIGPDRDFIHGENMVLKFYFDGEQTML